MPSKKFDLEKSEAKKSRWAQSGTAARYGAASAPAVDRREQRRLDQAAGLVAFATKLPADLITLLNFTAHTRGVTPGELLAQLLREGLPGYHGSTDTQEG